MEQEALLLKKVQGKLAQVLMEGVPPNLDVRDVHDLHVWTLTSGKEALSAHVLVDDLSDGQHVLKDLQILLRERFGIEHTTV